MIERKLEMILNEDNIENSPSKIQQALNAMLLAKLSLNCEEVYIKSKNQTLANHIFKILKLKQPQNINNRAQINSILNVSKKHLWGQLCFF